MLSLNSIWKKKSMTDEVSAFALIVKNTSRVSYHDSAKFEILGKIITGKISLLVCAQNNSISGEIYYQNEKNTIKIGS